MEAKRAEVKGLREREGVLRAAAVRAPPARGFEEAVCRRGEVRVIAELKRRSPGAGEIRPGLVPARLARVYESAGAAAISVLTDRASFGGALEELTAVRRAVAVPVLRKDFILEAVQVFEARAAGADAVLLIARILDQEALGSLVRLAAELGMGALVEVHNEVELERALEAGARLIGVNNRDLATFETSLDVSLDLSGRVPARCVLIAESGIRGGEDVKRLGMAGVDAVLVGEWLLRREDVGAAVEELVGHGKVERRHG